MTIDRSVSAADRRPARTLVAVVTVAALVLLWVRLGSPRVEGGSVAGVSSTSVTIHERNDDPDLTFVLPTGTSGEVLAVFSLTNQGRFPLTVHDAWTDMPMCAWHPVTRVLRDDPASMFTSDGPSRPLAGSRIAAGTTVAVWVTLVWDAPASCQNAALSYIGTVDVKVSVLGRSSTIFVPLGYRLGWTDHPEDFVD